MGQNIKFDIQYLKANDPVLNALITSTNFLLDDTMLCSFLLYEQRPEKGLKELATLFGLTDYSMLEVTGSSGTATSPSDPRLHYYNCLDVAVTLKLYDFCWQEIRRVFGEDSPKFSSTCTTMRNEVLWSVIGLESAGFCISRHLLNSVHTDYQYQADWAEAHAFEQGVICSGTGSKKSALDFMIHALTTKDLMNDSRVKRTEKRQDISVGEDNFNLLNTVLTPEDGRIYVVNQSLQAYHGTSKIINTYTNNLLNVPAKGLVFGDFCYPSWYPIPIYEGKGSSVDGGTIQGRFSCKKPAAQTFPPPIKQCLISRFPGGKIIGYDLSQIELRVGALLSGDPIMLDEYARGIDRHAVTALMTFAGSTVDDPDFYTKPAGKRQAGKILNFLVLFRGGAHMFQSTLMKEVGYFLDISECEAAIRRFNNRYQHFRLWQDSLIETARRTGIIVLPTGWSRSFSKGVTADTYINEICNFPIQTTAAQLMQSAEYAIIQECLRLNLRSRAVLQVHDALYMDTHPDEEGIVDKIMEKYLTRPPLLTTLERILGRTVPLEYEKEYA